MSRNEINIINNIYNKNDDFFQQSYNEYDNLNKATIPVNQYKLYSKNSRLFSILNTK